MSPTLLVFAKPPVLGQVKTRLAHALGDASALAVYRCLLEVTARAIATWPGPIRVLTAGDMAAFAGTPLASFPSRPQSDGGLGARLAAGFRAVPGPALAIGTDCPGLAPDHLRRLAAALERHPAVFGPAHDGGYWGVAVGDARCIPVCFADDLPWSRPSLLAETMARLAGNGIVAGMTDTLADLDDAEDLASAERHGFVWRVTPGSAERSNEGSP